VQLCNTNRAGLPRLSSEECTRVFEAGYKAHTLSAMSDGVGLNTVAQAVRAAAGKAWLSSREDPAGKVQTTFHVLMPAATTSLNADAVAGHAPTGAASSSSAPASITGEAAAVSPPICVGVDDDGFNAEIMESVIFDKLGADMSRSCYVGQTFEEQECFLDLALGRLDKALQPVPKNEQRPADLVLLDQNLRGDVLGSDLAQQLKERGFRGVTCIVTGSSAAHIASLRTRPGVDLAFEKGGNMVELASVLHREVLRRRQEIAHKAEPDGIIIS